MKYVLIDTETTGLDPKRHCVHQIAGKIVARGVETFNLKFAPHPDAFFDQEAIALNADNTAEALRARPMSFVSAYTSLREILKLHINPYDKTDKAFFVGYNARFDYDFVRAMWDLMGDKYFGSFFWFPPIDVMNSAAVHLADVRRTMPNFKLSTVAAALGITLDETKLHDALYDIELTELVAAAVGLGEHFPIEQQTEAAK
jgi:DNA polymerase-3 subunit epsilon